jgi:hypothetical protein
LKLRRIERVLHRNYRGKDREQKKQQRDRGRDHGEPGTAKRIKNIALERAPKPARRRLRARHARLGFWDGDVAHALSRVQVARPIVERSRGSTTV